MAEAKVEYVNGKPRHFSVGAIIYRDITKKQGGQIKIHKEILMINRKKIPLGWACPAGHIDKGESSIEALEREVKEETGLEIVKAQLITKDFLPWNNCSHGITGHYWYVYICKTKGKLKIDSAEAKEWKWIDKSNLNKLNLEPAWEYWFKLLNSI